MKAYLRDLRLCGNLVVADAEDTSVVGEPHDHLCLNRAEHDRLRIRNRLLLGPERGVSNHRTCVRTV